MNSDIRERLADLEHDRWSRWMLYMISLGTHKNNGTWVMPEACVKLWLRKAHTTYADLTEQEKESDRKEADLTIEEIKQGP